MRQPAKSTRLSIKRLPRLALTTAILLMLLTGPASIASAKDCPNQHAREQNNSRLLADCRSYEMVSPLDKNGADISTSNEVYFGSRGVIQSSTDGNKITYHALAAFGENPKGLPIQSQYLATRTPSNWTAQNITIPLHTPRELITNLIPYEAFNTTLTEGLVVKGVGTYQEELEEPPIGGAPVGYTDYYLQNFTNNTSQALLTTAPPVPPESFNRPGTLGLRGYAATPDLHHIILNSEAELTPGVTIGGRNLYEWTNGHLEPVNALPDVTSGETALGAELGSGEGSQTHTVSDDGSHVFWSIFGALYVREGVDTSHATTVQVDASQGGTGSGNGQFLTASSDGLKAFFVSHERLTSDATTPQDGFTTGPSDLYEFDVNTGHLTDLTVDPSDTQGANVQGVLGASDDGTYLYFAAGGALTPQATPQSCDITDPTAACNLYLWHAGSGVTFITQLSSGDENGASAHDWTESFAARTARVSPDGHNVVFMSGARLTPYDNAGTQEIYAYTAGSSGPVCVSCNPSGTRPVGPSSIPGATVYEEHPGINSALYASRVLASDGSRVFFDSSDALVSGDTDKKQDVYQWERAGTGTCEHAPGCISLISTGTATEASTFIDASEDGSDVFLTTRQQLTPGDTDQEVDLYDARENGGYPLPNPPVCTGTGCQGLPSATPIFATPPSVTAEGVGNFPTPTVTKHKALTRAQKLARALKTCAKKPRKQRPACQKHARSLYGPIHKTAKK